MMKRIMVMVIAMQRRREWESECRNKQTKPSNAVLNRTCTVFPDFEASGMPRSTPAFSAARPAHFPSYHPFHSY